MRCKGPLGCWNVAEGPTWSSPYVDGGPQLALLHHLKDLVPGIIFLPVLQGASVAIDSTWQSGIGIKATQNEVGLGGTRGGRTQTSPRTVVVPWACPYAGNGLRTR